MPNEPRPDELEPLPLDGFAWGLFVFNIIDRNWFHPAVKPADAHETAKLLFWMYSMRSLASLITKKEAAGKMQAKHSRTANKYYRIAIAAGAIEIKQSPRDARVEYLILTPPGVALIEHELREIRRLALGVAETRSEYDRLMPALYANIQESEKDIVIPRLRKSLLKYSDIIQVDPNFVQARYGRSNCYRGLGQYQEALDEINHILKLRPGDPYALLVRANLLAELNENQEGLKTCADFLRSRTAYKPKKYYFYATRARLHQQAGHKAAAEADQKRYAQELKKEKPSAKYL